MLRGQICATNKPLSHIFPLVASTQSAGLTKQGYFIRNIANPSIKYNLSAESKKRLI